MSHDSHVTIIWQWACVSHVMIIWQWACISHVTKPTPVTVAHSRQRAVTEYSSWRSESKGSQCVKMAIYPCKTYPALLIRMSVMKWPNNVAQFLVNIYKSGCAKLTKTTKVVNGSLHHFVPFLNWIWSNVVYHMPDLSLSLASQTHFHRKGKGLVNCVYKLCLTGMQLAGWHSQISNNALLNYLLRSIVKVLLQLLQ